MAKITVALPEGKAGLVFSGSSTPILSRVSYGGAMHGKSIKPGYIVDALTLGSGKKFEGLSKVELVNKLKESADDHNRKLTFTIAHKAGTHEVDLPSGDNVGITIAEKKGKAIVTAISHTSPLKNHVSRGHVVENISTEKFCLTGHSADDINQVLINSAAETTRKMTFKHPGEELSEKAIDYEEVVLDLPAVQDLGIELGGTIATVLSVSNDSPLLGMVFPGMKISAFRIEDGREYHGLPGTLLYKILQETSDTEGRQLYFPSPGTEVGADVTLKFYPQMIGLSSQELGATFESDGEALKLVDSMGSFDVVPKGVILLDFSFKGAATSEWKSFNPSSVEELDAMLMDSSGCERFFTFLGAGSTYMPDECVVVCPPGKLGVVFKGNPASLVTIKEGSPFGLSNAMPGMAVQSVTIDGRTTTNPGTKELTKLLMSNPDASRSVKLVNPETN